MLFSLDTSCLSAAVESSSAPAAPPVVCRVQPDHVAVRLLPLTKSPEKCIRNFCKQARLGGVVHCAAGWGWCACKRAETSPVCLLIFSCLLPGC